MKRNASILLYFGNQHACGRLAGLWMVLVTVALCISGCHQETKHPPPWAEESFPDYDAVKSAYRELAFEVATAHNKSPVPITNLHQLVEEIQKSFADTKFDPNGENPFPELLPQHSYGRLLEWNYVSNNVAAPLIWTTSKLREPSVLFITIDGKIQMEKPEIFKLILDRCIAAGFQLGATGKWIGVEIDKPKRR